MQTEAATIAVQASVKVATASAAEIANAEDAAGTAAEAVAGYSISVATGWRKYLIDSTFEKTKSKAEYVHGVTASQSTKKSAMAPDFASSTTALIRIGRSQTGKMPMTGQTRGMLLESSTVALPRLMPRTGPSQA